MTPNRRIVYATLNWCQEHHTEIIDTLRTLAGAAPLQMPASIDLFADPELKDRFERWWRTASMPAVARYKLYKRAWDLIGWEFAGRHMLHRQFDHRAQPERPARRRGINSTILSMDSLPPGMPGVT